MPNLYAEAADLKVRFGISDSIDDTKIDQALNSASRAIDQHCQRVFYSSTAVTATFVPDDPYCLRLADTDVWRGDVVSVTTLSTDGSGDGVYETTWAASDYQLWPVNAAAGPEPRPYTEIRAVGSNTFPVPYGRIGRANRVQITGTFGWPTAAPSAVTEACLMLAAELFKLKDAPFGIAGVSEFGGAIRIRENPKVARILMPYQRYPVLVA